MELQTLRSKVKGMMDAVAILHKEEMEYISNRVQKRRLENHMFQLRKGDEEDLELPTKKKI
eukprot:11512829-Ditylum_brightwellii.AAC.1